MKIYGVPIVLIALGVALMAAFQSTPRYEDPDWRRRVPGGDSEAFFREQAVSISTGSRLWHLGAGLASLGGSIGLGWCLLRARHLRDLLCASTPARPGMFFLMANLTWLAFIPAQWTWLAYTARRGDYPSWADSMAIPFAETLVIGMAGLPLINLGLAALVWRARLPAPLRLAPKGVWPWTTTIVIGLLAGLVLLDGAIELMEGNVLSVPLFCSVLYLLASGRAASASTAFPSAL
jgi:hypothetical protein